MAAAEPNPRPPPTKGEQVSAPSGRADDFSWPRGGAEGADPAAAERAVTAPAANPSKPAAGTRTLGEREFAVTLEGLRGRVPVVIVPPADELDRPSASLRDADSGTP